MYGLESILSLPLVELLWHFEVTEDQIMLALDVFLFRPLANVDHPFSIQYLKIWKAFNTIVVPIVIILF